MNNWQCIFSSSNSFKIEIIKGMLEEANLHPVVLNQKDSSYGFGTAKILVKPEEVLEAKKIIDDGEIDEVE